MIIIQIHEYLSLFKSTNNDHYSNSRIFIIIQILNKLLKFNSGSQSIIMIKMYLLLVASRILLADRCYCLGAEATDLPQKPSRYSDHLQKNPHNHPLCVAHLQSPSDLSSFKLSLSLRHTLLASMPGSCCLTIHLPSPSLPSSHLK